MGYKKITLTAIINIGIITGVSLIVGYNVSSHNDFWYLFFLIPVPISLIIIINNFNQSNQQVAFFFEAIKNDDASLKFPTSIKQKSLRHLYKSMNELNDRINEIKLQNEYLEKYYQTFIQHAAAGLIAINQDNEVEIMNDKAYEYSGIQSFTPLHLIPSRNQDLFNTLFAINVGETYNYKRFIGDSPINLLIRSKEIRYGGKASKLISLQDISHELDEKELDSWQKLIRVLTHEIMNSIAPITSLTGTLKKFYIENEKPILPNKIDQETIANTIEGLDTIEERGNGLLNFVNSYRKLTRIPKPEFAPIQVQEWLNHIKLLLQEYIEMKQIKFEIKIEPLVKEIIGDKKLLTQVLINILNNAMEALDEISDNRKINIVISNSKQNRTLIRISNNGPTINEDAVEKIFIPFFTTKEQGSGIGLSLSRQILRLHRGYIHVESNADATSFIITV